MVVGMGGMSPEYFHSRLTYNEARWYTNGQAKRPRPMFEAARFVADVVAKVAGNEKGTQFRFSWERDDDDAGADAPTEDEYAELMREKQRWEQSLNRKS